MHELALGTAFIAGILGSTHCVAMCGGIAASLGTARGLTASRWQPLIYQLGRIASYGIGGSIVGTLGAVAGLGFEVSRWSVMLRLGTAVIMVLIGLKIALGSAGQFRWLRLPERWGALLWRRIAPATRSYLPKTPALRALTLGLLWGWLPCGLVYSILLVAVFAGSAAGGAVTMLAFGFGTLPAMLGLSYAGARLTPQHAVSRLFGAVIVACGLWTAAMPIAILSGAHQHLHHAPIASTGRRSRNFRLDSNVQQRLRVSTYAMCLDPQTHGC